MKAGGRLHYIDWLRGIVLICVLVVHCSLVFGVMGWNLNSRDTDLAFNMVSGSLQSFVLPMLVFLAGASVFLSLRNTGARAFVASRAKRLLVPWALGAAVLSPIQVYFERVNQGGFDGGFLDFLPHYFDGFYGFGGNFAWMGNHLWFLLALFCISLMLLPFFRRRGDKPGLLEAAADRLKGGWMLGLMFLSAAVPMAFIPPTIIIGAQESGSWNLVSLVPFFILGYMFYANPRTLSVIKRSGPYALAAAILFTALLNIVLCLNLDTQSARPLYGNPFMVFGHSFGDPLYILSGVLFAAAGCCWLIGLHWLGEMFLDRGGRVTDYLRDASMPFYILHQPAIIGIGYFLIVWPVPLLVRYFLLLALAFMASLLGYELLVRRFPVMRVLFGLTARRVRLTVDSGKAV